MLNKEVKKIDIQYSNSSPARHLKVTAMNL